MNIFVLSKTNPVILWAACTSLLTLSVGFMQISENQLIQLLEQINEKTSSAAKVTFQRKRNVLDDDED